MELIPDWAPNIHPMLVHFPIALLCTAVLLDVIALLFRKKEGLRLGAVIVYVLGAVGALVTYLTGKSAGDSFLLSGAANTALTDHADWGTATMWFFVIYALVRVGVLWWDREGKTAIWAPLLLIGAGGLFLVYETAEHGAQMVYRYGVGVQAMEELETLAQEQQAELDRSRVLTAAPVVEENGSWRWTPGEYAAESLAESFVWLAGDTTTLTLETTPHEEQGYVLTLHAQGAPVLFVFDQPLRSIQADFALNLDDFEGAVQLVHHVQDTDHYMFMEIDAGTMRQGRVNNGEVDIVDEESFSGQGWQQFRVVSDQTHFRAYANGTLVTHGHGPAPDAGPVGLRLDGAGVVLLGRIDVQSLR